MIAPRAVLPVWLPITPPTAAPLPAPITAPRSLLFHEAQPESGPAIITAAAPSATERLTELIMIDFPPFEFFPRLRAGAPPFKGTGNATADESVSNVTLPQFEHRQPVGHSVLSGLRIGHQRKQVSSVFCDSQGKPGRHHPRFATGKVSPNANPPAAAFH